MHEAMYYQRLDDGRLLCTLCPHSCRIAEGRRGACGVRLNHGGRLLTLVYDKVVSGRLEPIEKKPLFHFMPGSLSYSIATVGCTMRCAYCQNWELSQWPKTALPSRIAAGAGELTGRRLQELRRSIPGEPTSPARIVEAALAAGARSIAYTFTEPTVFYELAHDTARLARRHGLRNVCVTNGFISEKPLRRIAPLIDAVNVDVKSFSEATYRRLCRASLAPVLKAIRLYRELGVWLELTTLIVPGLNDSDEELERIASFVRSLGPEVPWHLSRYFPAYKLTDRPSTPRETLERAAAIGRQAGLRYVYEGNLPGVSHEDTSCWQCGSVVTRRYGHRLVENRVLDGRCPRCAAPVAGVALDGPAPVARHRRPLVVA